MLPHVVLHLFLVLIVRRSILVLVFRPEAVELVVGVAVVAALVLFIKILVVLAEIVVWVCLLEEQVLLVSVLLVELCLLFCSQLLTEVVPPCLRQRPHACLLRRPLPHPDSAYVTRVDNMPPPRPSSPVTASISRRQSIQGSLPLLLCLLIDMMM